MKAFLAILALTFTASANATSFWPDEPTHEEINCGNPWDNRCDCKDK